MSYDYIDQYRHAAADIALLRSAPFQGAGISRYDALS